MPGGGSFRVGHLDAPEIALRIALHDAVRGPDPAQQRHQPGRGLGGVELPRRAWGRSAWVRVHALMAVTLAAASRSRAGGATRASAATMARES